MSERAGYIPEDDQPKDPGRRNFLKAMGVGLGSIVAGGAALGVSHEIGEYNENKAIEEVLAGPRKEVRVHQGDTVDGFYRESGYNEIEVTYYEEAFYKINKNLKAGILPEGEAVVVPYKGEE